MKNKKISKGSVIAFLLAICYIIGFVCMFMFFKPLTNSFLPAKEKFNYILENKHQLTLWYFVIYVLFGIFLIPLVFIIKNYFNNTKWSKLTSIFGYIWAAFVIASGFIFIIGIEKVSAIQVVDEQKLTIWNTISILQEALGGGIELIGGFWVMLIGINGFIDKKGGLFFNVFSLLLGLIGVVTIIPFLFNLGGVFGLLQIIWFIVLGFKLQKNRI